MTLFELIQAVTSIVTMFGVGIAAWQLYLNQRYVQSQFEDSFTAQYRAISSRLPLNALLGKELNEPELRETLRYFYEYFDLSNEQAFLHSHGHLRSKTWANWREGIEQHFSRPAFQQAWKELAPHLDGSFDNLKTLLPPPLKSIASTGGPSSEIIPQLK